MADGIDKDEVKANADALKKMQDLLAKINAKQKIPGVAEAAKKRMDEILNPTPKAPPVSNEQSTESKPEEKRPSGKRITEKPLPPLRMIKASDLPTEEAEPPSKTKSSSKTETRPAPEGEESEASDSLALARSRNLAARTGKKDTDAPPASASVTSATTAPKDKSGPEKGEISRSSVRERVDAAKAAAVPAPLPSSRTTTPSKSAPRPTPPPATKVVAKSPEPAKSAPAKPADVTTPASVASTRPPIEPEKVIKAPIPLSEDWITLMAEKRNGGTVTSEEREKYNFPLAPRDVVDADAKLIVVGDYPHLTIENPKGKFYDYYPSHPNDWFTFDEEGKVKGTQYFTQDEEKIITEYFGSDAVSVIRKGNNPKIGQTMSDRNSRIKYGRVLVELVNNKQEADLLMLANQLYNTAAEIIHDKLGVKRDVTVEWFDKSKTWAYWDICKQFDQWMKHGRKSGEVRDGNYRIANPFTSTEKKHDMLEVALGCYLYTAMKRGKAGGDENKGYELILNRIREKLQKVSPGKFYGIAELVKAYKIKKRPEHPYEVEQELHSYQYIEIGKVLMSALDTYPDESIDETKPPHASETGSSGLTFRNAAGEEIQLDPEDEIKLGDDEDEPQQTDEKYDQKAIDHILRVFGGDDESHKKAILGELQKKDSSTSRTADVLLRFGTESENNPLIKFIEDSIRLFHQLERIIHLQSPEHFQKSSDLFPICCLFLDRGEATPSKAALEAEINAPGAAVKFAFIYIGMAIFENFLIKKETHLGLPKDHKNAENIRGYFGRVDPKSFQPDDFYEIGKLAMAGAKAPSGTPAPAAPATDTEALAAALGKGGANFEALAPSPDTSPAARAHMRYLDALEPARIPEPRASADSVQSVAGSVAEEPGGDMSPAHVGASVGEDLESHKVEHKNTEVAEFLQRISRLKTKITSTDNNKTTDRDQFMENLFIIDENPLDTFLTGAKKFYTSDYLGKHEKNGQFGPISDAISAMVLELNLARIYLNINKAPEKRTARIERLKKLVWDRLTIIEKILAPAPARAPKKTDALAEALRKAGEKEHKEENE